jgi:hypothetical protein
LNINEFSGQIRYKNMRKAEIQVALFHPRLLPHSPRPLPRYEREVKGWLPVTKNVDQSKIEDKK